MSDGDAPNRSRQLVEPSLVELDAVIAGKCAPSQHEMDLLQAIPGVGRRLARSSSPRPAR
jgi:hypothetical protein